MKRIVTLDPDLDARILEIMRIKRYRDFQHFASIAFENQVLAEGEDDYTQMWSKSLLPSAQTIEITNYEQILPSIAPGTEIFEMETPADDKLVDTILWGQYYRFLPAKLAVRVLAHLSTEDFPAAEKFVDASINAALVLNKKLISIDKKERNEFGERLSAGFPDGAEKSTKRFAAHFLVYARKNDLRLDGMLARLKLVNLVINDKGEEVVGLTLPGRKFAAIPNPIIDQAETSSLSDEEIEFLINHIGDSLPDEAGHMYAGVNFIKLGINTPKKLNSSLRTYYDEYHGGKTWSNAVVNTMRVGLLGRLFELNLISKEKTGKNICYSVTDRGVQLLDEFSVKSGVANTSYKTLDSKQHGPAGSKR